MKRKTLNPKTHKRERGTVSVVSAFGMVAMLLGAGLAVDVSHMYLAGGELQNAADAAAIAGASRLNGFPSGITSAVDKTVALQNRYEFGDNIATTTRANVRFAKNLNDFNTGADYDETSARAIADKIRFLRVLIPDKSITVPFASLALGSNSVNLSRTAVAGFSAGLQTLCAGIVPLAVIQDDITHQPLGLQGSCSNTWAFTPGCTYIIRSGDNGQNTGMVSAGNYQILAIGMDKGGADARLAIAGNPFGCYKPGDVVATEPGINASAVRFGLNTRFGEYAGGLSYTTAPPDLNIKTNITYEEYRSEASQYWTSPDVTGREGRRIIILPIVNISEFNQGMNTIMIYKFAAFFMREKVANGNGGDITAEYISGKVQVGDGSISTGTGTETQFSVPVLYK
jgi:Flp pilus assembly protein TadG